MTRPPPRALAVLAQATVLASMLASAEVARAGDGQSAPSLTLPASTGPAAGEAPTPPAAPPLPSPSPPRSPALAHLHVDSPAGAAVVVETHAPGSSLWTSCCRSPCDAEVPLDQDYRVSSDTIRPSACLRLAAKPGDGVVLGVHPVSRRVHTTGLTLVGIGIVLFTTGDIMSDVFLAFEGAELADKRAPPAFASEIIVPGLVLAAIGAVAFGTGGAMFLLTRDPTRVDQTTTPKRDATETASLAPLAVPTALTVPVLSLSF